MNIIQNETYKISTKNYSIEEAYKKGDFFQKKKYAEIKWNKQFNYKKMLNSLK